MTNITIGQQVGNYRIQECLGAGGMGAVYQARHVLLERQVAIKVLHHQFATDPQIGQRFINEARAVNLIDHPCVVQISEADRMEDGTLYLVMELLRGESLRRRIERLKVLSGREALRIVRQLADVLAAAHDKNIVHRDLKPENVMLVKHDGGEAEQIKLLDFGIAKLAATAQSGGDLVTVTGMVMGTPSYMSPEQCIGAKNVDGRSDVYALGVVAYQMLSGRLPLSGDSYGALIVAHLQETPLPLRVAEPSVSADVDALVNRMLSKDPAQRPSAREVVVELDRICDGGSVSQVRHLSQSSLRQMAGQLQAVAGNERPARGRPWLLGVPVLLAVAGGGVLAMRTRSLRQDAAPASSAAAQQGTPSAPSAVHWAITTEPPGARLVDVKTGEVLGTTPCQVRVAASPTPRGILLRLDGYTPHPLVLAQDRDVVLHEKLQSLPHAAETPSALQVESEQRAEQPKAASTSVSRKSSRPARKQDATPTKDIPLD